MIKVSENYYGHYNGLYAIMHVFALEEKKKKKEKPKSDGKTQPPNVWLHP